MWIFLYEFAGIITPVFANPQALDLVGILAQRGAITSPTAVFHKAALVMDV